MNKALFSFPSPSFSNDSPQGPAGISPDHSASSDDSLTEDTLLGGRVHLRQPANGYRTAIDPVFLAAAAEVSPEDKILDVGSGVGAASLCLATRVPSCKITGLELSREAVLLGAENIRYNNFQGRLDVVVGTLLEPPPRLAAGTYSHVISNPPYREAGRGRLSPWEEKEMANAESDATLEQWIRFCLLMVRPKGIITLIHQSDRLHQVLACLSGKAGDIRLFPLWPKAGKAAKRVLIQGRRNTAGPTMLLPGMVLHHEDGTYTREADAILRDGAPLTW